MTCSQGFCEARLNDLSAGQGVDSLFPIRRPLELEIGCGKGRFIIRSAVACPDRNFLAVEVARRFHNIALRRANSRQLANLRLLCTDAKFLIRHVLADASLRAVHILFPDPWPKTRHKKRRMLQPDLLHALLRVLEDDGCLNIATDHQEYWEAILVAVACVPELVRMSRFTLDDRLPVGELGHTNYEVKYRRTGRVINQGTWRRRGRKEKPGEGDSPGR